MTLYTDSKIKGAFRGWGRDMVFELANGQKWQQARYKYKYRYKYRPVARIWHDGSRFFLQVSNMEEMVQVRRVR